MGIPVVALPMGADQPDNADRCAELGVGITLDPLSAAPTEIVAATQAALDLPNMRTAAAMLATETASQPALRAVPTYDSSSSPTPPDCPPTPDARAVLGGPNGGLG
jgi:UDP:flavonoid glycosyltransferase YjiC (YdhE family)